MPFQTVVNSQQAPAVKGDFAGANPRHVMVSPGLDGAISAGVTGCIVGNFAWVANATGVATNAHPGVASKVGFVNRSGNVGLITTGYPPGESTLTVPWGQMVTIFDGGDFWASFAAGAAVGQKVFASYTDGSAIAGTAGSPPTIAATASFATTVMTVTATAGVISPGMPVNFTSVTAGTFVVSQATGTPGGVGTYNLSTTPGTVGSAAGTITTAFDSGYFVDSLAGNGELAIISTRS